jgi:hypothetical protein
MIVGVIVGFVLVAFLCYLYKRHQKSKESANSGMLAEPLLGDGKDSAAMEMAPSSYSRPSRKKMRGGMQAPLLQNDTLEMSRMSPSSTDAESYDEISTTSSALKADVSVLEQVETFRVRLGFQISLRKTADSDERTGSVLLQGSTFEVDKKAVRAKESQVFLHAVGEGWALQHHPKSGEAVCERAWSIRRSEVDFDELNQATNSFDQSLEIGDGGSCTVYRATIDSIPCAIKVLAENADEWDTKQFASEVNLLRRVQHSNLCRLYASSTNGPRKCLVLEHMGGGALDKRLVAQPPLGWQQRVSIALETCRGLDYLHSLNPPMIHRDVSELTVKLIVYSAHLHDAISSFPLRAFRYFVITRSRARTSS